jgi:hypothetical protein
MGRRTPRVEGRRSGARAIGKNTSLRYEWPELMISQRDGYHHEAHSLLDMLEILWSRVYILYNIFCGFIVWLWR